MPQFNFRCVNKQGETYDISRHGATYEEARRKALEDGHSPLPVQPSSFLSGTSDVASIDTPMSAFSGSGRDTNLILESIDAKLSEVLRFTKLARIVLIVMICFWILGMCVWLATIVGIFGKLLTLGR